MAGIFAPNHQEGAPSSPVVGPVSKDVNVRTNQREAVAQVVDIPQNTQSTVATGITTVGNLLNSGASAYFDSVNRTKTKAEMDDEIGSPYALRIRKLKQQTGKLGPERVQALIKNEYKNALVANPGSAKLFDDITLRISGFDFAKEELTMADAKRIETNEFYQSAKGQQAIQENLKFHPNGELNWEGTEQAVTLAMAEDTRRDVLLLTASEDAKFITDQNTIADGVFDDQRRPVRQANTVAAEQLEGMRTNTDIKLHGVDTEVRIGEANDKLAKFQETAKARSLAKTSSQLMEIDSAVVTNILEARMGMVGSPEFGASLTELIENDVAAHDLKNLRAALFVKFNAASNGLDPTKYDVAKLLAPLDSLITLLEGPKDQVQSLLKGMEAQGGLALQQMIQMATKLPVADVGLFTEGIVQGLALQHPDVVADIINAGQSEGFSIQQFYNPGSPPPDVAVDPTRTSGADRYSDSVNALLEDKHPAELKAIASGTTGFFKTVDPNILGTDGKARDYAFTKYLVGTAALEKLEGNVGLSSKELGKIYDNDFVRAYDKMMSLDDPSSRDFQAAVSTHLFRNISLKRSRLERAIANSNEASSLYVGFR